MRNILSLGLVVATTGVFMAGEHDEMGMCMSYVGKVGDGGAMIGVVTHGKTFLAYVCSDNDDFNASHARWFRGEVGDKGAIKATVAGATLAAYVTDGKVSGKLTGSDKKELSFTASAVKGSGGVFRAEVIIDKEHYVAGWVRDDEGATTGGSGKAGGKIGKAGAGAGKGAPSAAVGGAKKAEVTGTAVDALEFPLPGQLAAVTLTAIDSKKLTLKSDDGKSVTVFSTDKVSLVDSAGKRTPISLTSPPDDLKVARRLHISIKCLKRDKKTGRCNDRDISISFD